MLALGDIHADHQLAVADLLNPHLLALPHYRKAGARGFQLGAVGVFENQLQGVAHGYSNVSWWLAGAASSELKGVHRAEIEDFRQLIQRCAAFVQ